MKENSIKVLEEVTFAAPKTKEFINVFNALGFGRQSIIHLLMQTRTYIYLQETYQKLKF